MNRKEKADREIRESILNLLEDYLKTSYFKEISGVIYYDADDVQEAINELIIEGKIKANKKHV
jgi:hypothetical protein